LDFSKTKFVIRIIPTVSPSVFSLSRLHPDKNGIRNPNIDVDCLQFATPQYNNDILGDMFMKNHLALLHQHVQDSQGLVDALVLGKIWLQQRNMSQQEGHVDGFVLGMLMIHLFQTRKLNRQMSSYQILRVFMQFIGLPLFSFFTSSIGISPRIFALPPANHDMSAHPLQLKLDSDFAQDAPGVEVFRREFDLVFLDSTGHLNLLARVSKLAWEEFRHEATLALAYFQDALEDTFDALFLKKQNLFLKFDNTLV